MGQGSSRWWLMRAWRASRSFTLFVLVLILGQAWASRDGVIRFPFVHWWMYAQPFPAPDSVDLVWLAMPEGPLDPASLGAWQPRHAVLGLLENQLPRLAGEGYGDAAARAWMTERVGPAMDRFLPAQTAARWQARILPPQPDSTAWSAWLARLAAQHLRAESTLWAATYRVQLYPDDPLRWEPVLLNASLLTIPLHPPESPAP